jgi:hypothetical protein
MTTTPIFSVPLIIKPWHKATLRWVSQPTELGGQKLTGFYRLSFEGPGFKKEWPFRFESVRHAFRTIKKLGFTQYRVKHKNRTQFDEFDFQDPWDEDGVTNWKKYYQNKGLIDPSQDAYWE